MDDFILSSCHLVKEVGGKQLSDTEKGRYSEKVVLVTGGGSGIGASIAEKMAAEGASVAVCGRQGTVLDEKVEKWTELGYNALSISGDVTVDAAHIVHNTVRHFGRLDVLVNNAGVSAGMAIDEMSGSEWRRVMNVNLGGVFQMVHHAMSHLVAVRGSILHISSISAVAGELDDAAYAASKAGLEGFSRKLALELAPMGVRSNVIRPGLIRTEAFADMPDEFFEAQMRLIPLLTIGVPEDIASAAAFLCSDDAQFITGAVLTIDGGESAK